MDICMYTRRDIAKLALAAPLASAFGKIDSNINGVMLGAQTYSFRDRSLDDCINAMKEIGIGYAELYQGHVEPRDPTALKAWRTSASLGEFKRVRKKFDDAGIVLYSYYYDFRDDLTDHEIDYGFRMAKALGVNKITSSSNISTVKRIDPFASRHKVYVGIHNHSSMAANEISTPDDFQQVLASNSKYIAITLDIGHFTAAGFDPVSYLEQQHNRILALHVKDRKRNQDGQQGEDVPFGQGETKIKEVLQLLKTEKYRIPALIEYEYGQAGMDAIAEVKKSFEFCKTALA